MDSQGKDTELEITKIGVSNSGDSLQADQLAKKKLLEQTKKLSNTLKVLKNLKNPGLEGREFIFYIVLRTRRHNSVGECQMLVINMGTEAKNKKTEA